MGLGTLSKAFMLFAESITMALDGGLHRDVGDYDIFNPIEREVRKRTFWSIYCWDKQSGACFGRPAMIQCVYRSACSPEVGPLPLTAGLPPSSKPA